MSEPPDPPAPDDDQDLERQVRSTRKFSLNEAIGRLSGGDFMKGGSAITRKRQAELTIDDYLRTHLTDTGGALRGILLRHADESLLQADYDKPLVVFAEFLSQVLASAHLLEDIVREADVTWGRTLGERPHFEKAGVPADPDDPYTANSVRAALQRLLEELRRL